MQSDMKVSSESSKHVNPEVRADVLLRSHKQSEMYVAKIQTGYQDNMRPQMAAN